MYVCMCGSMVCNGGVFVRVCVCVCLVSCVSASVCLRGFAFVGVSCVSARVFSFVQSRLMKVCVCVRVRLLEEKYVIVDVHSPPFHFSCFLFVIFSLFECSCFFAIFLAFSFCRHFHFLLFSFFVFSSFFMI